jgi:P-type E1-E2 ATPase
MVDIVADIAGEQKRLTAMVLISDVKATSVSETSVCRQARRVISALGVADPVKESTPDAIRELPSAGLKVIMFTGDRVTTAKVVAEKLGIEFEAGVLAPKTARWSKTIS